MEPMHPRVRNASSFSKASSNGQDQASFSKLALRAKIKAHSIQWLSFLIKVYPCLELQPPFTSARVPFDCHFCEPSLGWCTPRSRVEAPLALFQVREVRVLVSSLFRTVFALVVDCMVGSVVLMCELLCELVSPKRDETGSSPRVPARKVAQAARSTFERAGNSPRREGSHLSEIPRCSCFCSGETSGVALQWSGRNSMAPVSGCPWWCPICITSSEMSSSESSMGIHYKCKHPLNPTKLYVSG
ncbi:hypothetical protein DEO72_LG10g1692 [Vigna unguiculata]|uniref:Uncharacterized protein n=1 Tax=Vigna unguiculata TaxID=3917 RepID=A0A4D6NC27_VIGUN|nr:hypothetical protein DEO72_LG10g1692 [Vigna unguiculata]